MFTSNIVSPLRIVQPRTVSNTQSPCKSGMNPFDIKPSNSPQELDMTFVLSSVIQVPHGYAKNILVIISISHES